MRHHGRGQSPHDAGGPRNSFAAHLESLRAFRAELQYELEALVTTRDKVYEIEAAPLLLGEFTEADELRARHHAMAASVQKLIDAINEALRFADRVTDVVIDSYRKGDALATGALTTDGTLP